MPSNIDRGRIHKTPREEWWADVLADPRARKRQRRTDLAGKQAFYPLGDEKRETILVACSEVRLAGRLFPRRSHRLPRCRLRDARPTQPSRRAGFSRRGSHWDRCGVHYVKPIEGARYVVRTQTSLRQHAQYLGVVEAAPTSGGPRRRVSAQHPWAAEGARLTLASLCCYSRRRRSRT